MPVQNSIELRYSAARMLGLAFLGVVMAAVSLFAGRVSPPGSFVQLTSWIGVPFFGACTVLAVFRLIRDRGKAVVRLTEAGLTDIRLAPEEIPWHAIRAIGTHTIFTQNFLVLDVDPACEASLMLTPLVRRSRKPNLALGINGLATTAQGLPISHDDLLALCKERLWHAREHDAPRSYTEIGTWVRGAPLPPPA